MLQIAAVAHYTVLYCIVLYCTVLYNTVQYCTKLNYTILCRSVEFELGLPRGQPVEATMFLFYFLVLCVGGKFKEICFLNKFQTVYK